jgi:hypothetical protein
MWTGGGAGDDGPGEVLGRELRGGAAGDAGAVPQALLARRPPRGRALPQLRPPPAPRPAGPAAPRPEEAREEVTPAGGPGVPGPRRCWRRAGVARTGCQGAACGDASVDCFTGHGPASRGALRAWSSWAGDRHIVWPALRADRRSLDTAGRPGSGLGTGLGRPELPYRSTGQAGPPGSA